MKLNLLLFILFNILFIIQIKADENLLKGTMICSVDNSNYIKYAFDNRLETQFQLENESYGWVGLNLRSTYHISRIEWGINNAEHSDYLLGIFEGANEKSFADAIPLYMITEQTKMNTMNTINIEFQGTFSYIRYVGPSGSHCKINNIRIFGEESSISKDNTGYYKPTNLPLMVIHSFTSLEPSSENDKVKAYFYIIVDKDTESKKINGEFTLKGTDGLNLYKKSYYIKFSEDEKKLLNFTRKSKNWALFGNYGDKTLLRNLISYDISEMMGMVYTIECTPIDVMVNGEYKGTYNLCEKIEVSDKKINIKTITEEDNEEPGITGGYLLEINGFAYLGTSYFNSKKGIPISIRYPDELITSQQKDYINDKFDELEMEIYENILSKMDIKSFVKYFLFEELIGNDMAFWSTYIYKNRNNEKFYFGVVWDNDMAFDNDKRAYQVNCKKNYAFNFGIAAGSMDKMVNQILKNTEVTNEIKKAFKEIIANNTIDLEKINRSIDEKVELIAQSRKLNFMRWKILDKLVESNPKVYSSYEEEISVVKDFLKKRIIWLKDFILDIKCESCINCAQQKTSSTEIIELDYEMESDIPEDGNYFQPLSHKTINVNIFNIFAIVIFILF